ncbi:hypothetical protein C0V75_06295 [Tabrizicola sp. TH137]|nr:hypothetical protein C0V75_06295 [Tabrizicola sp. TH137]
METMTRRRGRALTSLATRRQKDDSGDMAGLALRDGGPHPVPQTVPQTVATQRALEAGMGKHR